MTRVALRGLLGRKLRAALTAVAIVLGVAMVSGTFMLTDTIDRAFGTIFSSSYERTDAVVTGVKTLEWSENGKPTVPASLLERVRELPEVEAAAGTLLDLSGDTDQAQLLDKQGDVIEANAPTFGFGVDPGDERFNPFTLTGGRWASGGSEVVIDAETASKHDYRVGDRIGVVAEGPVQRYTIVGIARFGDVDTLGGATIAVFDVRTAQALHGKTGYDAIAVAAKPGVSQERLLDRLSALSPDTTEVRSGAQQAEEDSAGVDEFVSFIRYFLLAFAGIALFVGGFVIFNTLSITVAQRTRELATVRTLGASRGQVLRSVALEGLVLGIAASAVGLALGVALARGLTSLFSALELELPQADMVLEARTVVVSLLVGTVITFLASLVPAIRATRVPAISAVREGAAVGTGHISRKVTVAALLVLAAAGSTLAYAVLGSGIETGPRIVLMVLGALGTFVGVAMLAPRLVGPLASVVGFPSARLGGAAGRLARDNALRNPGRTATTAAALMIGLTLVTFVSVLGAGLIASGEDAVRDQVRADYVVGSTDGWDNVPVGIGRAASGAEGVEVASSVRHDQAVTATGDEIGVSAVDPATIERVFRFDWADGSDASALAGLGRGDALVRDDFADEQGLAVGDRVSLRTAESRPVTAVVRGIYAPPEADSLLDSVVLTHAQFDASFPRPSDAFTLVAGSSQESLERSLAQFPNGKVSTLDAFVDDRVGELRIIMNLFYVLLGLSVIVSLFGMVNTLVLAVFERTRELGMLRAVGMTRRQTRRMIRHEGVITALIGAGIGLPLGVGLAALVTQALSEYGVGFSLPVGTLAAFTLVAVVAGMLASLLPARRAARLNVLRALQYE